MYFYFKLIPYVICQSEKTQMIQLVNKQIHTLIFGRKIKKYEETKNIRLSENKSKNIVMCNQKKKNSDRGLSKRRNCKIQGRANINIGT